MTFAPAEALLAGRFVVEREVGRGGVGIVYQARDQVTGEAVALKVIAIAGVDAGEEARFQREGRVLSGLSHPSIVRVVDFGQLDQGQPYVAMEWLEGEDVAQRLRRAPLTLGQCLDIAAMMADALASAHAAGVIHRDVKPSNIILVGSARENPLDAPFVAKLVDFGVAVGRGRQAHAHRGDRRHPGVHGARAGTRRRRGPDHASTSTRSARRSSR